MSKFSSYLRFVPAVLMLLVVLSCGNAKKSAVQDESYSVVILGDTHYDTEPASVYHSDYNEPVEWLNRVQRAEFARNGEMWRERCPRLVKRAKALVGPDTKFVYQAGDLIQGDCGNPEVHKKMLKDVMDYFKGEFSGLPFVTVEGNHDHRGTGAKDAYHEFMPARMSQELGIEVKQTNFSFRVGPDVYIVIDFSHPDDAEIDKLLDESKDARYTFVLCHSTILPPDGGTCRWFFHGSAKEKHTLARRHFRERFAQRNVIVLCGHEHTTDFMVWEGDGGSITQMTVNSVWSGAKSDQYILVNDSPESYGTEYRKEKTLPNGKPIPDESELFAEYKDGVKVYSHSFACGSYKMHVSSKSVTIDFYAGDSQDITHTFVLR